MKKLIGGMVVAGLLAGTIAVPAAAQPRRNGHGPAAQKQAFRYHEVQASRGHKWRKGQRLAPNQRRYVVNDWQHRGLRAPPRGYRWERENNNSGDFLLVAAATGLIASILAQ